jgi:hypothetical protein
MNGIPTAAQLMPPPALPQGQRKDDIEPTPSTSSVAASADAGLVAEGKSTCIHFYF